MYKFRHTFLTRSHVTNHRNRKQFYSCHLSYEFPKEDVWFLVLSKWLNQSATCCEPTSNLYFVMTTATSYATYHIPFMLAFLKLLFLPKDSSTPFIQICWYLGGGLDKLNVQMSWYVFRKVDYRGKVMHFSVFACVTRSLVHRPIWITEVLITEVLLHCLVLFLYVTVVPSN